MHAVVTPEIDRHDRRRAVRPHEGRRGLHQHRAGRAARHRRARRSRWSTATSVVPASTTSSASTSPSTTRSARWRTSCSPRTSAARPTTPRRTTRRLIADGLVAPCSTAASRTNLREPGGAQVSDATQLASADEIKAAAPRDRQGDADVGPGRGHRRQRRRPPARRQRGAHAVVARLPHDDARRPRRLRPRRQRRRGPPRPDHREGAAPGGAAGAPRDQRDHALPRQALHDVRPHPPADPGGDRGVRRVRRRRRAGRRLQDHGHRRPRRGGREVGQRPQPRC